MHKSILVLEESRMVHELFESALPEDYISWEVNHESTPDKYLQKAEETNPDIIFLSNQDKERNYKTVKQLKSSPEFSHTPILLLTSAKDTLDESHLQSIGVKGFVRKPFETSTLQKQINVVLKEQEQQKVDTHKDRLKDLNVVDDDLMDLLGGQGKPEVSLDELEEELDPTLQLIPEDSDEDEETEETELLAMDDSGELDQAEFIDDEIDSNLDLDAENNLEIEDIGDDIEIGELDDESDFMDLDDERMTAVDLEPEDKFMRTIQVVEGDGAASHEPLLNIPEDRNDLGFMELHVVPLRREEIKSHVVETITDDFNEEEFVKKHAPVELEDDFISADSEIIMDITQDGEDGDIEIPHEEIVEDFYEGDDDLDAEAAEDEKGLLELSIEGMDGELSDDIPGDVGEETVVAFEEPDTTEDSIEEINIPDMNLPDDPEDVELVLQVDESMEEGELATVSQDDEVDFSPTEDGIDVEIDFHSDPMPEPGEIDESQPTFSAFDEDEVDEESLTVSELEKRRSDQLDIELEEIAAAGSEEASATIQEMIGFRQVMKAKYDIPEEDLEIDDLADGVTDEIGEDEDLFSEVEDSFPGDEEETGDLLDDDMELISELPEDDDPGEPEDLTGDAAVMEEPELMTELPEEDDALLNTLEEGEDTALSESPVSDDQDVFSPLPDEFPGEDDVTLLAELPEEEAESEISPLMEEESEEDALLAELPDDEGQTDDLFMEELSEDEPSFTEEVSEPAESPLMDDTLDDMEIPDSPGDLLLDVDESEAEEKDNLDLLTDEIDEETEEGDLALLSDEVDTTDLEDEQLDDIDLLSEMDEEGTIAESETENGIFGGETASPALDETDDEMFAEPSELPMAETLDPDMPADDDIFVSTDDDPEALLEPMELSDDNQTDLLSIEEEETAVLDEPMEEIELLSNDSPGEDSNDLFQTDNETDVDALAIDEEDSLDDTELDIAEESALDTEAEFDATASSSMDDIDFLPIDEDSDEEDVELEVEIEDTATTDENTEFAAEDADDDHSVEDIDFLPVDEEEASQADDEEQIEDIPLVELSDESEEPAEEDGMTDIDFMPADTDEDLTEMNEVETSSEMDALTEEDEVTIEVPQETFEMGDFNIGDITSDEDNDLALNDDISDEESEDMDLMSVIETTDEDTDIDQTTGGDESYNDIELPTMDEDLPDLPPISTDDELEEETIEDYTDPLSDESDIQLMQEQSDFDDFDSEQEIIGLTEDSAAPKGDASESEMEDVKQQAKKAAASLTPEFRKKLSEMIEGVVSETVHNTLQEKLPGLVDKLVNEEMEE